jgi:hypothetical protein
MCRNTKKFRKGAIAVETKMAHVRAQMFNPAAAIVTIAARDYRMGRDTVADLESHHVLSTSRDHARPFMSQNPRQSDAKWIVSNVV